MISSKSLITPILLLFNISVFAQGSAKVYSEEHNGLYHMYVDNDEFCEVSLIVTYRMTNMKSAHPDKKPFVIPARTKKFEIDQITSINPKKDSKFDIKTEIILGDITKSSYDKDFQYFLPFKKGESYEVFQGYNGSYSHKNENALDFTMKIGTEVTAIRDGIVVQVVSKNSKGCKEESCKQFNNFIIIYHSDGTFVEYTHISKNSNKVNVGDQVKQGDVIALSGNVGWSSGPHLHLVIFRTNQKGRETLSTKFLVDNGSSTVILKENNSYTRNY